MIVLDQYPHHNKSKVDGKALNPRKILHKVNEYYDSANPHLVSVYFCADDLYFISISL
jgi:hypothetical protein